jgi:protein-L-isoaspartate(D-aspartate) O-methyltransferase
MNTTSPRRRIQLCLLAAVLAAGAAASPLAAQTRAQFDQRRDEMVREVIVGAGVKDPRVVKAMQATPRHEFVAANLRAQAYFDMALPIGDSQTISSPFIVAYMTESIDPQPTDTVLEIGTGSGYQAAVLSPLVKDVYSIEIVEALGQKAQRTLKRLPGQAAGNPRPRLAPPPRYFARSGWKPPGSCEPRGSGPATAGR